MSDEKQHECVFVFIRQETEHHGWEDRYSGKIDVFFCQGCLRYQRIKVEDAEGRVLP